MNLRQGCIGRQESLCMAAIAACSSGLFTFDSSSLYSLGNSAYVTTVSYTHLRAHETVLDLVCRLLLEKKKNNNTQPHQRLP